MSEPVSIDKLVRKLRKVLPKANDPKLSKAERDQLLSKPIRSLQAQLKKGNGKFFDFFTQQEVITFKIPRRKKKKLKIGARTFEWAKIAHRVWEDSVSDRKPNAEAIAQATLVAQRTNSFKWEHDPKHLPPTKNTLTRAIRYCISGRGQRRAFRSPRYIFEFK